MPDIRELNREWKKVRRAIRIAQNQAMRDVVRFTRAEVRRQIKDDIPIKPKTMKKIVRNKTIKDRRTGALVGMFWISDYKINVAAFLPKFNRTRWLAAKRRGRGMRQNPRVQQRFIDRSLQDARELPMRVGQGKSIIVDDRGPINVRSAGLIMRRKFGIIRPKLISKMQERYSFHINRQINRIQQG